MREKTGNLFKQKCNAIVIPCTGAITDVGEVVMGTSVAKKAAEKWSKLPKYLGRKLIEHGTHVVVISEPDRDLDWWSKSLTDKYVIIMLPITPRWAIVTTDRSNVVQKYKKKYKPGKRIAGHKIKTELSFVEQMLWELKSLCDDRKKWKRIVLAQISAEGLDWKAVRPLAKKILDSSRFIVVK